MQSLQNVAFLLSEQKRAKRCLNFDRTLNVTTFWNCNWKRKKNAVSCSVLKVPLDFLFTISTTNPIHTVPFFMNLHRKSRFVWMRMHCMCVCMFVFVCLVRFICSVLSFVTIQSFSMITCHSSISTKAMQLIWGLHLGLFWNFIGSHLIYN